jgi:hypothetical protein
MPCQNIFQTLLTALQVSAILKNGDDFVVSQVRLSDESEPGSPAGGNLSSRENREFPDGRGIWWGFSPRRHDATKEELKITAKNGAVGFGV